MKLAAVASDPMEFRGLLDRASQVRRAAIAADWARLAVLGNNEWLLVAHGAGEHRAAAALDAALAGFAAGAAISLGYCGALVPGLGLGDIVVANEVAGEGGVFPARVPPGAGLHRLGPVRTIGHIAQSAAEKRHLAATGACAVEMEAAAVAQGAQKRGLPFYCVKAVTDLAGEDLTIGLNEALREDGHFDTMKVLGLTLRHPMVRVPELVRLRRRSVRAAQVLGAFFADCQF